MDAFQLDQVQAYRIVQTLICLADTIDLPLDDVGGLTDTQVKWLTRPAGAGWRGREAFAQQLRDDAQVLRDQLSDEAPRVLDR